MIKLFTEFPRGKKPLLCVENIRRAYKNRDGFVIADVLKDVTFSVYSGESVAVLGPSGSGKTTLLNLCGLLDREDAGGIIFAGEPTADWNDGRRDRFRSRELGLIFQEHMLLPQLTAIENVLLSAMAPDMRRVSETTKKRARGLLDRVGLIDKEHRYPGELSTGERQRVAVARALLNSPKLVLADEPTGALDSVNSNNVAHLLLELTREHSSALLMATHSEAMAALMDRSIHLYDGSVKR